MCYLAGAGGTRQGMVRAARVRRTPGQRASFPQKQSALRRVPHEVRPGTDRERQARPPDVLGVADVDRAGASRNLHTRVCLGPAAVTALEPEGAMTPAPAALGVMSLQAVAR